ncbi:DUF4175 domain-containing protein [Paracoccus jiaweipingae]|uniref:DUF4175 domain-containing protein n=1 Tax=unclassified Paracoccus (in: a-proteobacteria) TaxID=2688777 RepID=UPI0037AE148A
MTISAAGLWWEAFMRVFWPALSLLAGLVALVLLGGGDVPRWPVWAGLAVCVMAALWGLWRFRRPDAGAALRRVDSRLPGRPLAALADRPAMGGGGLWDAHRAQMAARALSARPVAPDAGLARRDPLGLRLVALLALAMAGLFGAQGAWRDGLGALALDLRGWRGAGDAVQAGPAWEGWAQPPAYTRRPALYLNALAGDALDLPKGSRVSLRFYGPVPRWSQDLGAQMGGADAPEIAVAQSGRLRLPGRGFDITVLPDAAPVVAVGDAPMRRADGRMLQDFTASDDFGIALGQARIALDLASVQRRFGLTVAPEPRDPVELALPLPSRGDRRAVSGRLVADLARHPWANLPVTIRLEVADGIGQTGQSQDFRLILPGRRFFDPLAAALAEIRRDLLWSRDNARRSAEILRAVTWQPEGFIEDDLYQRLRAGVALLEGGPLDPAARDRLAEDLWQAAVRREDGGLDDALDQMRRAQEKLSAAMRNGASPDEIARLMDELAQATRAYTDMLAQQQADPAERFTKPREGQRISADQIQQMMDEIQRLMAGGRMAEAQALLDQFNRMMQSLKVTQGEGGKGAGDSGPSGQGMGRLADSLRQQQDLADESFRALQDQYGQWGADDGGLGDELADRQRDLREEIGRQQGLLPGRGSDQGDAARQGLDRAGRAMREAEQALRQGDMGQAMDRQAEAIEGMRQGMRALGQILRQRGDAPTQGAQQGAGPGDGGQPGALVPQAGRPRTDPLGRVLGGQGAGLGGGAVSDDPLGALADQAGRARDLLDEIRRRSAQPARPQDERDYLGRLLDRF